MHKKLNYTSPIAALKAMKDSEALVINYKSMVGMTGRGRPVV